MCQVSANTTISCFDVGASSSPSNKTIYSFLVHFLLLLSIETLNVNDNMIHKEGQVSANIIIGSLMWMCLPRSAIRSFVHFIVRYLLKLAIETFNVNEDMVLSVSG